MKEEAIDYAKRGWYVFPCRVDKTPYTPNGVLDATLDTYQIEKWWSQWPNANIGMDCGRSGFVVVDLDPGHDVEAFESAITPDTGLVSQTPRGGTHLFYLKKKDEIIPPSASKVAKHVDIRSFNSYVLLAPSKTKDGPYEWVSYKKPALRSDALVKAASQARQKSKDHDTWIIEPDLPENVDRCIQWLRKDAQIAIEGVDGDHKAYSTAAMCKSFGISPEKASELMWEHWNPRCDPPWSSDQIDHFERKIENGYSYNTSPPGNMTDAYHVAKRQALFKPSTRTLTSGVEVTSGRFRILNRDGIDSIKPPTWLIKDAIPERSLAFLIGQRGTYKTFIALDMALSIATGASTYFDDGEWHGTWPDVSNPGNVIFAVGEGRSSLKNRIRAWESKHLDDNRASNFYLADPVPSPNEDDLHAFLEAAIEICDYTSLIVLDTLGRSMQGMNESAQQDASQFTKMTEIIQRELNTAVLVLHHEGHEAKGRSRGSSVFGADADCEFVLARHNDLVELHNTKQKDAPEWEKPKLIQLSPHRNSLVAVKPAKNKLKEAENQGTRKSKEDVEATLKSIRDIAYEIIKSHRPKEWSKAALADAIAADIAIEISATSIRKRYIDELLTDKGHPVAKCYNAVKGAWMFKNSNPFAKNGR